MARSYAICGDNISNEVASTPSIGQLVSVATVRPKIYEWCVGSRASPSDNAATYGFKRFTTAGTVTAFSPTPLDPADPPALCIGTGGASSTNTGVNTTVEPTYTANTTLAEMSVNLRTQYRWVANPGKELVAPATAASGLGLFVFGVVSAYNVEFTIYFEE